MVGKEDGNDVQVKKAQASSIRRIKSGDDSKTQWTVKLNPTSPPLIAHALLHAFRELMKKLYDDKKESLDTAKRDSDLMLAYERVKGMLKLPLILQHQNSEMKEESEDQTFRDLRREVIVVNGQMFDQHIAKKVEDALPLLQNEITKHLPHDVKKDVVKWVLLACTRTVHGGDVHSILHEQAVLHIVSAVPFLWGRFPHHKMPIEGEARQLNC